MWPEEQLLWLPGTDKVRGHSLASEAALVLALGCVGSLDCSADFGSWSVDSLGCWGVSRHSCEAWEKKLLEERLLEETWVEVEGGLDVRQIEAAWQEAPLRVLGGHGALEQEQEVCWSCSRPGGSSLGSAENSHRWRCWRWKTPTGLNRLSRPSWYTRSPSSTHLASPQCHLDDRNLWFGSARFFSQESSLCQLGVPGCQHFLSLLSPFHCFCSLHSDCWRCLAWSQTCSWRRWRRSSAPWRGWRAPWCSCSLPSGCSLTRPPGLSPSSCSPPPSLGCSLVAQQAL